MTAIPPNPNDNPIPPLGCTLVLCFDDTAHPCETNDSNVIKLYSLLHNEDDATQMVYYQVGALFSVLNALMCL